MKNGNLYKLAALLMTLVLMSAVSFAQKADKKVKKEKTYMIKMEINEDGETSSIDTIIIGKPDIDVDKIMEDIKSNLDIDHEKLREIHEEVIKEMEEAGKTMQFEFKEKSEELENAMSELKAELKKLEMSEEAQQRIDEAMQKLEEQAEKSHQHMERFMIDKHHPVFIDEDGKYEVIVNEDGKNVETKVIWVGEDDDIEGEKKVNVWYDSDNGESKVIIKSGDSDDEYVFFTDDDMGEDGKVIVVESMGGARFMSPSKEEDIDKAIAAGLAIDKNKMLETINISIEIKDDKDPLFTIGTNSDAKLKASIYDENFKLIKKLKVKKQDKGKVFELNLKDIKESNASYIFLEQDGKTDLMRVQQ